MLFAPKNFHLLLCFYLFLKFYLFIFNLFLAVLRNIGEGNGIPLQYSSLENPMDGGAW